MEMCCVVGTNKDKGNISEAAYDFECSSKRCVSEPCQEEGVKADEDKSEY